MSWFGTVVGGAFGFFLGGPLGAVLGASVAHQIGKNSETIEPLNIGDQQRVQMAFFTATFSVMGHLAKADGVVSTEEISQATRIMDEMALTSDLRATAIDLFKQGKQTDFKLDEVLAQFHKECHRRIDVIRMFVAIQLQVAYADGGLSASEEKLLLHICGKLKLSRFDYERLKIQSQAQQRFQSQGYYSRQSPRRNDLHDAYGVLGLPPSATQVEVKKAYRRLMNQNHPDKLVAKGLPEEMMVLAKEKTQKISKAYETIQKSK